jgi:hypothetical protein
VQELRQKTKLDAEALSRSLFFLQEAIPLANNNQLNECRQCLAEALKCVQRASDALTKSRRPQTTPGMKPPRAEPDADRLRELLQAAEAGSQTDLEVNAIPPPTLTSLLACSFCSRKSAFTTEQSN